MNRGIDPVMGDRNATHKMITGSNWSFFMNTFMEMMVEGVVQAIRQGGLRSCYVVSTHRISQSLIKGPFFYVRQLWCDIRCALLALTLVVAACENEKKEPEVEVSLDEEKLGRETDKNVLLETRKLVDESIVQKDQELVSALPSSSSEEAEESTVRIEITAGGKLYGSRGENRSLLAEKVTDSSLEQEMKQVLFLSLLGW